MSSDSVVRTALFLARSFKPPLSLTPVLFCTI